VARGVRVFPGSSLGTRAPPAPPLRATRNATMEAFDSFLDETFLRQLETLKLLTAKGIRGPYRGEHKSWKSGEGLEFLDYRTYQPGDDVRYVDWSVYGRFNKFFVKLFHAEENQTVHVLLDVSRSMNVGRPSKILSAKRIAAAVSYICLSNFDRVTITAFADRLLASQPPVRGKRKYAELLRFLHRLSSEARTNVNECLAEYAATSHYPGILLILSDLFDPQGCEEGLKALAHRHFDVYLIQVLTHEELFWSHTGPLVLQDVETRDTKVTFVDKSLAERYRQRVEAFLTDITRVCGRYGLHHHVYDTSLRFEDFLIEYFSHAAIVR